MIIKREENGDIVKGFYNSSNILVTEYNKTSKDLTITFSYGGVYTYHNVPEKDYFRFELADSQGKVLNSHIKTHDFTKVDAKADVDAIKSEIKQVSKDEKKSYEELIIKQMRDFRVEYYANTKFSMKMLGEMERTIATYRGLQ